MGQTQTQSIRSFILKNLEANPRDIASVTGAHYSISRQAVHRHLLALESAGLIDGFGRTRARAYRLRATAEVSKVLRVTPLLEEDIAWNEYVAPSLKNVPDNIREICFYGFTEVLNNVLDHAEASRVAVNVTATANAIDMAITDDGRGIFSVLRTCRSFVDNNHAALELAKGRLTTAPETHSGGTLYFAMKMFDRFSVHSEDLIYVCFGDGGEARLQGADVKIHGTSVRMSIAFDSKQTLSDVFETYAAKERDGVQVRTHIPVALMGDGFEAHVTRSQGKRLVERLDTFEEVLLDFKNVESIGRAFADEVFRTFRSRNPHVSVITTNANPTVRSRIRSVLQEQNT